MDLALFDFDGTITDREMFVPFLAHAVERRRFALGKLVLGPLALGYKAGFVSGDTIRAAAVRVGLTGVAVGHVQEAGESFASDVLPGVIRPVALERIRWHQERGDEVAVVTGALELAVGPWGRAHGLHVIGSVLAEIDGYFTGRYAGAQCLREEKVRRVCQRYELASYGAVHVYGDTPDDFALLGLADHGTYRWREFLPQQAAAAPALQEST
ncbi:hydrolase [Arenimonas soli]|uniref:Hydrolase n=1 Tax=Arenimonas soli TaxID=2269504 RepID=A0ABQ1HKZ0_9GAMM|nr:HAD family hydrolase [Arenimonas soli]GGA81912.1 hydrolase [Arenimonas soli]